ncbi:MAG: type II secretion system protein M [Cocleimonas sp.]
MSNWLNSLSPRERALVSYGSIAVLIVLVWLLGVKPLYNNQIKLIKTIDSQKATLATMQKQSVEIKQLLKQKIVKPTKIGTQNPQQLIDRSLQTWRLKPVLERMQSQGSNGVRLTLRNANADRVMRFLHELESKHSLSISNMSIDSDNKEAGFADFKLTIKSNNK